MYDDDSVGKIVPPNDTMKTSEIPSWLQAARDAWQWRGSGRPDFAQLPKRGQVSVWDFPRPLPGSELLKTSQTSARWILWWRDYTSAGWPV